jgi:hypothetical protein
MKSHSGTGNRTVPVRHESHFENSGNHAETLSFSEDHRGQSDPRHYPHPDTSEFPLGEAMNIEDVALIFGCTAWTVRQKYVRQGLPCLRTSPSGKFVFFRRQVLDWILKQQRKEEWK